jgi:hypothetical protein
MTASCGYVSSRGNRPHAALASADLNICAAAWRYGNTVFAFHPSPDPQTAGGQK